MSRLPKPAIEQRLRGNYSLPLWAALFVLSPPLCLGAFLVGAAFGLYTLNDEAYTEAFWLFSSFGFTLVMLCIIACYPSFALTMSRVSHKNQAASHSKPRGILDDRYKDFLSSFIFSCALAASLLPALLARLFFPIFPYSAHVTAALTIVAIFVVLHTLRALMLELRAKRAGKSRIFLEPAVISPGETADITFHGSPKLSGNQEMRSTLLCIEEVLNAPNSRRNSKPEIERSEVYRDEQMLSIDDLRHGTVSFTLPDEAPTQSLPGYFPLYWELIVATYDDEKPWSASFLVPVVGKGSYIREEQN